MSFHVQRTVRAVWRFSFRWGSQLGDVREYQISRSGENVSLFSNGKDFTFNPDQAREIGEALIAAADWKDDRKA
jgi:hypothetical protein